MSNISIVNKTAVTKENFKKAAKYNVIGTGNVYWILIILALSAAFGVISIISKAGVVSGYMLLVFSLVIFPILYFYLPYKSMMDEYKEMSSKGSDSEVFMDHEFSNNTISSRNPANGRINLRYENITEFGQYKDILVIYFGKEANLVLNVDSFTKGSYDELLVFLKKKTGKEIKNRYL